MTINAVFLNPVPFGLVRRRHRGSRLSAGFGPVWIACLLAWICGCGSGTWLDPTTGWLFGQDTRVAGALAAADDVSIFSVDLSGGGAYQVVDLGASAAGDEWTLYIQDESGPLGAVTLALLDAGQALQYRSQTTATSYVRHTLRHDTDQLYVGLQSQQAARFSLVAARRRTGAVPPPEAQVVWLNFDGAQGVQIGAQPAVSFGPFDASVVGPAYVGQTLPMEAGIADTVRQLYANYNVTVLSSAEMPEPVEPHSTIHFGGNDGTYIGMGEAVDQYDADLVDQAIVYTSAFAPFANIAPTPEDMARMIGNTAGHELGHLLGLFHTRGARNLMDDSRSAQDLAAESTLAWAPLAETVFPVGVEDAPAILAETVGLSSSGATK